jgi:hypothetical protein
MIKAQLADGRVLEFPDGTDPAIIQKTVKAQLGISQQEQQQPQPVVNQEETTAQQETEVNNDISIPEQIIGGVSGAATLASDFVGSVVAGNTALVDQLNPFTDNNSTQLMEKVKANFTIPPTQGGQNALNELGSIFESTGVGDLLDSIKKFSEKAGQQGLDFSGSPAFATFVQIIPDIILEVGGGLIGRGAATSKGLSTATNQAKKTAISEVNQAENLTGIRQLTSDITPPKTRVGKLLQTQGELVAGFQRTGQQAQRIKSVENLANKFDIVEGTGFEAKVVKGLQDSVQASKAAIGKLYDESTAKLDELGSVPLTKTKSFAQVVLDREIKKGSVADQSVINDMQSLLDAPDDLSFEFVKEIRSGVGANLEKVRRGAPVQGNSDTALLNRTYGQLSQDMTAFADNVDPALSEKWKKANKVVSEFALGTSKSGAKAIIKNGDATPEIVDRLLFSGKNSDIEFLSSNLTESGKTAAKQRVLQRAFEKSSIDGEDINPNKFLTQLNKSRNQIGKLFSADERKAIFALRDQLKSTTRAQDASVVTPTGQQLTLAAAVAVPVALIPGVIQGVIESKVIRDLIIKRRAALTGKQRAQITSELQSEIDTAGIAGAGLATPLLFTQEQE